MLEAAVESVAIRAGMMYRPAARVRTRSGQVQSLLSAVRAHNYDVALVVLERLTVEAVPPQELFDALQGLVMEQTHPDSDAFHAALSGYAKDELIAETWKRSAEKLCVWLNDRLGVVCSVLSLLEQIERDYDSFEYFGLVKPTSPSDRAEPKLEYLSCKEVILGAQDTQRRSSIEKLATVFRQKKRHLHRALGIPQDQVVDRSEYKYLAERIWSHHESARDDVTISEVMHKWAKALQEQ
jgi:hypothetical protein